MAIGVKDSKPRSIWPAFLLGPRPGLKEVAVVCWSLFVILLVIPFAVVFWLRVKAGASFRDIFPIDFIYFYGLGRIANEYPPGRVYDAALQVKVFNEIWVLHDTNYGPSPYPPFVVRFFSFLAKGGIEQAYFIWFGMSLTLFLAGIADSKSSVQRREAQGVADFLFWVGLSALSLEHARCRPDRIDRFFCCCNGHLSRSAIEVFCERIAALDSDL
jgi:hypothetical protein